MNNLYELYANSENQFFLTKIYERYVDRNCTNNSTSFPLFRHKYIINYYQIMRYVLFFFSTLFLSFYSLRNTKVLGVFNIDECVNVYSHVVYMS